MTANTAVRVLFVEDSEADVELALLALRRDGFEVSWQRVESEAGLRRAVSDSPPEVILSDFAMPAYTGMDALRLARELAPTTPFIFVSGTIGEEQAIDAIRQGATDYVLKNNLRRLSTAVRRALSEAEERRRIRVSEEERARLVEIMEATSDYVGMSDPSGKMMYLNAAGCRLVGAAKDKVIGEALDTRCPGWAQDLLLREALPTAERAGLWQGESALLDPDGIEIPVSQVIIAHRAADGRIRFFSTIARDIRERKSYEEQIRHSANYDALTDLPNRSLLGDRAVQALAHARRTGGSAALLVLDLDRFKFVNDSLGHGTGDRLLCLVADRLRSAVGDGDTLARLGADAFAVLATDLARPDDALTVARKIAQCMQEPFALGARELHATVSVGASAYPRDGDTFEVLLRNADAAMHRVKEEGRNGFHFYADVMTREMTERVEIEHELRIALDLGELEVHFQPQIALADNRMTGVEALIRWNHRKRGAISPTRFIPVAEELGLIHALGNFALRHGCERLQQWDKAGLPPLRLAVNASASQFRSPDLLENVRSALEHSGLDPRRLELELTEAVLVENQDETVAILRRFKALGMQIAVDDFGTGYSSLSYLSRLPVDCLKIDRSFVHRIAARGHDAAIVQAIISLAHALGMRVVAEGVETAGELDFLRAHDCEEVQGYLLSKPVRAESIPALASKPLVPAH